MKPFILAGCLLAFVTAAQARPWEAFHCGKFQIGHLPSKYFSGAGCVSSCDGKDHYFDLKKDPNVERPLPPRSIRNTPRGLFYKGNACTLFEEDDYEKLK